MSLDKINFNEKPADLKRAIEWHLQELGAPLTGYTITREVTGITGRFFVELKWANKPKLASAEPVKKSRSKRK